jgi:hypothetical protein
MKQFNVNVWVMKNAKTGEFLSSWNGQVVSTYQQCVFKPTIDEAIQFPYELTGRHLAQFDALDDLVQECYTVAKTITYTKVES